MEFDFNNTKNRFIFHIVGEQKDSTLFDINQFEKTSEFHSSIEKVCKTAFMVLNYIKDYYYQEKVFHSEDDIKEVIEEVIKENSIWKECNIDSLIGSLYTIISTAVPYIYEPQEYNCDEDDIETVKYSTNKSKYVNIESIDLYKVEDKIIYKFELKDEKFYKIAQIF